MNISDRIKFRMERMGLRGVDICRSINVSSGTITHWTNGSAQPSGRRLFALADVLGCSPDWILFGGDIEDAKKSTVDPITGLSVLPVIREVAGGRGVTTVVVSASQTASVPAGVLESAGVDLQDAVCAYMQGPFMAPVLPEGALICIHKGASLADGKLYAFDHGGLLKIRSCIRLPGDAVRMRCANADYENEDVPLSNITIIGRVIWYSVSI